MVVKFDNVVFKICEWTNKYRDRLLIAILHTLHPSQISDINSVDHNHTKVSTISSGVLMYERAFQKFANFLFNLVKRPAV